MPLDRLFGNEQLKSKLRPALRANKLSHAYILTGPDGSGRHTLALLLAAAMQCTAGDSRPCCVCAQCRKVLAGTHPDVITVDDPKKKTVSVDLVRDARTDLYVRPNEGLRKIYIFPRAMDLGPAGQNALLKVLEEPPAYGSFLLLTDNAQKLLPTIRSRSVELQLTPLPKQLCLDALRRDFPQASEQALESAYLRSGGFYGQASQILSGGGSLLPQTQRFSQVYPARDAVGLCELLVPMERLSRDQLQPILAEWLELLTQALEIRTGTPAASEEAARIAHHRNGTELLEAISHLQKALDQLAGNISVGNLCGALQIYLR